MSILSKEQRNTLLARLLGVDGPAPAGSPSPADRPEQTAPAGVGATSVDTGSPNRMALIGGFSTTQIATGVAAFLALIVAATLIARS